MYNGQNDVLYITSVYRTNVVNIEVCSSILDLFVQFYSYTNIFPIVVHHFGKDTDSTVFTLEHKYRFCNVLGKIIQ